MPRTINDIIPPSRRRSMGDMIPSEESGSRQVPPRPPLYPRPHRRFPWMTAGIALVVVVACVSVLYAFSGAKVDITPTQQTGSISGTFTATPGSGELPYELVTVQKIASVNVPAESTVVANDTAQGSLTIYNEQTKPQQLIKNTRFQTPTGLIFRIHETVRVPAAQGGVPGSLTVTVYADSAGESYNITPTTFTLPGLADTPQAKQVYAKSTTAMVGGFSGKRPAVSQATGDAERVKLKAALAESILSEVTPKIPEGYALVPGSVTTTYTNLPDAAGINGDVAIKVQATATAVVFPMDALARLVAEQVIDNQYTGQNLRLRSVAGLALTPVSEETPTGNGPFEFTLSGSADIVWEVDAMRVAGAVAGKTRTSADSVLSGFPEIDKAYITLRPFWRSTFPSDPADITIVVDGK